MRTLYILLFVVFSTITAFGQNLPEKPNPPRIVNDFAGVLSPQEQNLLEQKLRHYNDTTSTQIAIVTIKTTDGYDASEYAFALGRKWGIGQKGKNNGILILVKPKNGSERGQAFIATGYGMEGAVTDAQSSRIVRQILIPNFKNNQFYKGLDEATSMLIQISAGEFKKDKKSPTAVSPLTTVIIFLVILIIVIAIAIVAKKRASKYGDTSFSSYSSQGYQQRTQSSSLPFWLLMLGMGSMMSNRNRYSNGGWNDFSGGGGGFGGGGSDFGGFGGGDFGGGGAGGSW
jgi:Beta-propeller domains of methanol dehydrogenase type